MKNVKSLPRANQSGFTLIELIVVIVILGILAATALPRFMDAGKEARVAALSAVRGSLTSAAALAHSRWLIKPETPIVLEGVSIPMDSGGYPTVAAGTAYQHITNMAGLSAADYTIVAPTTNTDYVPQTLANEVAYVPIGLASSTKGKTCYVKYAQAAAAGNPPVITQETAGC